MKRIGRNSEFILNMAFTGAVSDKSRNPAVPYTTYEILKDAQSAAQMGFAMGHFHVRDNQGHASNDAARYADLFSALGEDNATFDMVKVASTSGRHGQTIDQRIAVLGLADAIRPDMASLTLSSLNFADGASVNSPDTIRALARAMRDCGVKPELEVFDLGMVNFLHRLADEGLVDPPFYVNVIFGNIAGLQADALASGAVKASLPQDAIVSFGGIGASQGASHLLALAVADGLRTGLEDSFRLPGEKSLAANDDMGWHAVKLTKMAGRDVSTAAIVRARLGLAPACSPKK